MRLLQTQTVVPAGDRPFEIVERPSRAVVRFYNKRGTAEQWIKEEKQAVKMTRLSCHRFRSNQVRLSLSLLAYNPGNLWRRLGPFRPEVRYNLARSYSRANRRTEAERERAEFARVSALTEREERQSSGQSYRSSGDRGNLQPPGVSAPPEPSPK